jgi:GNAT superfamily N-acetyltransferase
MQQEPLSPAVRQILATDAAAAARLCEELGYPASISAIEQRISTLADRQDSAVYVACLDSKVVGWIGLSIVHHLQSDPYVEIGGLVVASEIRSQGIGSVLLSFAEKWAASHGINTVVVRSRVSRERAHLFYERAGYTRVKTSLVFHKLVI